MKLPNHPGLAAVFSFLLPGLGQIYNGHPISAVIHLFIQIMSWVSFVLQISDIRFLDRTFLLIIIAIIILNTAISSWLAYRQAENHNADLVQEEE